MGAQGNRRGLRGHRGDRTVPEKGGRADSSAPAGLPTRALTVVVAPFVIAWLALRALPGTLVRMLEALRAAVMALLVRIRTLVAGAFRPVLQGLKAAGRAVVELAKRFGVLVRGFLYAARDALKPVGRAIRELLARVGVVLRAAIRPILRTMRATASAIAHLLRRTAVLVKAGLTALARAIRAIWAPFGRLLARAGILLRAGLVVAADATRWLIRVGWRALAAPFRLLRRLLGGLWRAVSPWLRWSLLQLQRLWPRVRLAIRIVRHTALWLAMNLGQGLRNVFDAVAAVSRLLGRLWAPVAQVVRQVGRSVARAIGTAARAAAWPIIAAYRAARRAVVGIWRATGDRVVMPIIRALGRAIRDTVDRLLPRIGRAARDVAAAARRARSNVRMLVDRQRASIRALRARFTR